MANITESTVYEAGIYQLETTDPVLGGASGIANLQGKQLANRTKWLKSKLDLLGFGTTGVTAFTGNLNTALETACYYATTAATNKPSGATQGFVQVVRYSALDYSFQTFHSMDGDRSWTRRILDGPVAQPWSEVARAADVSVLNTELVGSVSGFATSTAPTNWLKCNGAAVSRSTYAALFAKIGVLYGAGNGSTTFNLPDLRGEFIRGWDDGRGIDTGRVFGSAQADELRAHVHSYAVDSVLGTANGTKTSDGVNTGGVDATNSTGGSETRPRNVALLYAIKFQ